MQRWLQNTSAAATSMPNNPRLPGLSRIADLALEYLGVDESQQTITICNGCYDSLLNNK